jgi:hypothetical protein
VSLDKHFILKQLSKLNFMKKIGVFMIGILFPFYMCLSPEERQMQIEEQQMNPERQQLSPEERRSRTYRLRLKNCMLMDSLARLHQLDSLCSCSAKYDSNTVSVSCLQEPLDIYQCNHIGDPGTLYTDGLWIWSADLNYYTEFHHFLWPAAFLDHIQKQNKASCSEARLDEISEVYLGTIVLIQHEFVLEERKVLEHTIEVLS